MNTPTSVKIKRQILMVICAAESCMVVVKLVFENMYVLQFGTLSVAIELNPPKTKFGFSDASDPNSK